MHCVAVMYGADVEDGERGLDLVDEVFDFVGSVAGSVAVLVDVVVGGVLVAFLDAGTGRPPVLLVPSFVAPALGQTVGLGSRDMCRWDRWVVVDG